METVPELRWSDLPTMRVVHVFGAAPGSRCGATLLDLHADAPNRLVPAGRRRVPGLRLIEFGWDNSWRFGVCSG
jgi:hypothetical protein